MILLVHKITFGINQEGTRLSLRMIKLVLDPTQGFLRKTLKSIANTDLCHEGYCL